jgi:hypothetical protein
VQSESVELFAASPNFLQAGPLHFEFRNSNFEFDVEHYAYLSTFCLLSVLYEGSVPRKG